MIISITSFFMFLSSVIVITSYSPITSVVYLILTFILTAIYLVSHHLTYIALTYIIVYVGAVITLFLFVVIMINLGTELSSTPFTQTLPLTLVTVIFYTILINQKSEELFQTLTHFVSPNAKPSTSLETVSVSLGHWHQIQAIGFELYTHQAMWLVLVSMVLMISMIGPIVICRIR